jgi:curli biogenesis system outer membrane secretion channel CsgG
MFHKTVVVGTALAAGLLGGSAMAAEPVLMTCPASIGTVAIQDSPRDWWSPLGLSNPEALIKLLASRSGCLRVVARGAALQMRQDERALGDSGELRRGQNLGKGQVTAADYLIVPDIVDSNANAGGGGLGGAALSGLGRGLGGRMGGFGGVLGSISVKTSKAHTLLTLVNTRTTEQEYVAEGQSTKNDIGLGGGGFGTWGALAGGGYSNTDIGRVISLAYIAAFNDLVTHMRGVAPGQAAASAPIQAYTVTNTTVLRQGAAPAAGRVRDFKPGDLVYPTGAKNGIWWEADDENGNRGWVLSTQISPRG